MAEDCPVLLIHFNRPDATRRQIEELARLQPSRVWVLCDGAREEKQGEPEKVEAVRAQLQDLPWPCEVSYLFRESNLGCFQNISTGIDWFLEAVPSGIILEDDCLVSKDFFQFCTELLERYQSVEEVFSISGYNGHREALEIEDSYLFSNYFSCWGWATWRRAWKFFDRSESLLEPEAAWRQQFGQMDHSNLRSRLYWSMINWRLSTNRTDSWAYRFQFSSWANSGLSILPKCNLVENTGFQGAATNTSNMERFHIRRSSLEWPLKHPEQVSSNRKMDAWIEDNWHSKSLPVRLRWFADKCLNYG